MLGDRPSAEPFRLILVIAGRRIELHLRDRRLPDEWYDAFSAFSPLYSAVPSLADVRVDLALEKGIADTVTDAFVKLVEDSTGVIERVSVNIPDARGELIRTHGGYHGCFRLQEQGIFGISATLQIALALVVEERGGLLLHASGVLRDGVVWLFCGKSGAGKTTIATEIAEPR
jgi:hypothetical protein